MLVVVLEAESTGTWVPEPEPVEGRVREAASAEL
jgi:hypothetical protein